MINEKTLELNLAFELLTVADQLWSLIQFATSAPRVMRACHCFRPLRLPPHHRPPFAIGLTLQNEKREGWDVKIQFPSVAGRPTYALFLQFKQGEHKNYSTQSKSVFRGSAKAPKPFCEFEFNNNSDLNQHVVLRGLATQPSLKGSVCYAFPRIPNVQTFKACLGRLLHVTTIHTVAEIDKKAQAKKITIKAGTKHKFRTSYTTPLATEVSSDPEVLDLGDGDEGDVFADIVAIRVHRALTDWQGMLRETWHRVDFEQVSWAELFRTFQVEIGRFLAIDPRSFVEITHNEVAREDVEALGTSYEEFRGFENQLRELVGVYTRDNVAEADIILPEPRRHRTMALLAKKLDPYRRFLESSEWLMLPVPRPETTHTISVADETNLPFEFVSNELSEEAFSESLSSVAFQAI